MKLLLVFHTPLMCSLVPRPSLPPFNVHAKAGREREPGDEAVIYFCVLLNEHSCFLALQVSLSIQVIFGRKVIQPQANLVDIIIQLVSAINSSQVD